MKYCPVCENDYPDDVMVCPQDGAAVRRPGSRPDPFIGRVIRDRYRVERQLGKGGMGTVYLAEQLSVGRKVALKVLGGDFARDQTFVERFRQEAKLLAGLNQKPNPHVTLVHDLDQAEDGSLFIVMEWLEGHALNEVVEQGGALELRRAIRLATQIAQGLEAAHRAGVIHRDVKPHNIMVLSATDDIKLMDFGIARLRDANRNSLTLAGTMMGTPDYMSPEQIDGQEITEKTDLYSFGVVFYQMLTGVVPFRASTSAAVLTKQLRELPMPPRRLRADIPVEAETLVLRALEKDPADRQQGMSEIVQALREISRSSGESSEREYPAPTVAGPRPMETILSAPTTAAPTRWQPASASDTGKSSPVTSGQSFVTIPPADQTMVVTHGPASDIRTQEPAREAVRQRGGPFAEQWSRAVIVGVGALMAALLMAVGVLYLAQPGRQGTSPQGRQAGQGSAGEPKVLQPPAADLAPPRVEPPQFSGDLTSPKPSSRPAAGSIDVKPGVGGLPKTANRARTEEKATASAKKRPPDATPSAPQGDVGIEPPITSGKAASPGAVSADQLRTQIEERLRSKNLLRGSGPDSDTGLTVEVSPDRVVILRGIVRDIGQRDDAVRLAQVTGVTEVRSRINVQRSWN